MGAQRGPPELQTPVGAITVPGSLPGAAWRAVLCPEVQAEEQVGVHMKEPLLKLLLLRELVACNCSSLSH